MSKLDEFSISDIESYLSERKLKEETSEFHNSTVYLGFSSDGVLEVICSVIEESFEGKVFGKNFEGKHLFVENGAWELILAEDGSSTMIIHHLGELEPCLYEFKPMKIKDIPNGQRKEYYMKTDEEYLAHLEWRQFNDFDDCIGF